MKCILLSTIVLALLLSGNMYAQVTIKTGYISSSRYKNEDGQETDGRGDLRFVEGNHRK